MMQTSAFEDDVIVAALSRLSYEFGDVDPEVSRVVWDLAVAIAGEYGLAPSKVVRVAGSRCPLSAPEALVH